MNDIDINPLLINVCSLLKLGDVTNLPEKLAGGALHQNWKVKTSKSVYVIKKLNSQISKKPKIKEKYEETELIASRLQSTHIPAVSALKIDSQFVHSVDGHLIIVYPYVKGEIVSYEHLQPQHTEIIGRIFADIHSCKLHHNLMDSFPHYDLFKNEHWMDIINCYNNPQLMSLLPTILKWNERYHSCISRLNQEVLISHRDLHYSNVLWNDYTPYVIDWESAGYTNPLQEVIGYGLEWSGIIHSQFNKELFTCLIHSYINQNQTSKTSPEDAFFGWLGNSVMGWTEFNLRRAKEDCFYLHEQKRGVEILNKTMIPCIAFIGENMTNILESLNLWEDLQRSK